MFSYRMEDDRYALVDEFDRIHWAGEEVAVAFSYHPDEDMPGTLHQHGSPEAVNKWAAAARKKYADAGHYDLAKAIIVFEGKILIEELNKMIEIAGYIGVWYKIAMTTEVPIIQGVMSHA